MRHECEQRPSEYPDCNGLFEKHQPQVCGTDAYRTGDDTSATSLGKVQLGFCEKTSGPVVMSSPHGLPPFFVSPDKRICVAEVGGLLLGDNIRALRKSKARRLGTRARTRRARSNKEVGRASTYFVPGGSALLGRPKITSSGSSQVVVQRTRHKRPLLDHPAVDGHLDEPIRLQTR